MKYLLDTNVISDFVKGHPAVMARLKQTAPRLLGVSSITAIVAVAAFAAQYRL